MQIAKSYHFVIAILLTLVTSFAWAEETLCFNNGGSGWALTDAVDNTTATSTSATNNFQFADVNVPIADINIDLDISHTYVGDLAAVLTSPSGTSVGLFYRPGTASTVGTPFGCGNDDINVLLDDEAGTGTIESVCAAGPPAISGIFDPAVAGEFPGAYPPTVPAALPAAVFGLNNFDGEQPDGNWTLDITDNAANDTGTFNEICMTVRGTLEFDKWVSSNATCSDTVDTLSVASGTTVYYCYSVTNYGTTAFTVNSAIDDQGIDISGLETTYNPSDTVTVVQSVTAGVELPTGLTTNTATVTSGTMSSEETASVTVLSTPITAGSKPMYLWSSIGTVLSRAEPTVAENRVQINGNNDSNTWNMSPTAYSDITINGDAGFISVILVLTEAGPGGNRDFTISLGYDATTVGSLTQTNMALSGTPTAYPFNIPIGGDFTVPQGGALTLTVTNTTGPNNRRIRVYPWENAGLFSSVQYTSRTVINTDLVTFYDAPYPGGNIISGALPGSTVYIRGQITDPFGSFDITGANLSLFDNLGAPVPAVTAVAMSEIIDSGTNSKAYEYTAGYTLPAFGSDGTWRAEVTGIEGTEGSVSHMGFGNLIVGTPSLMVVKSASGGGTANPGDVITYSIIVTNTGTGFAENVVLDDDVSLYTHMGLDSYGAGKAFQFIDGGTSSGLVMNLPAYSNNNGTDYLYTPSSGAGGAPAGYDGNVTNWQLPFLGSMQPGGSFTLNYQMQIK